MQEIEEMIRKDLRNEYRYYTAFHIFDFFISSSAEYMDGMHDLLVDQDEVRSLEGNEAL